MFFFFFKQKTAYEMRISDWSSDVCSSDLRTQLNHPMIAAAQLNPAASSLILAASQGCGLKALPSPMSRWVLPRLRPCAHFGVVTAGLARDRFPVPLDRARASSGTQCCGLSPDRKSVG